MTSSPLRSKSQYHARSVSLPSRSHPLIPHFNEHLCRLKASETAPASLASTSNRLNGLEDLYDCVDNLLLLPHTQQTLAQEKWVDEALDGYLRLLDACSTTKDIFSNTKEDVKEQLSILRRKRDVANNFSGYLASRKKAKKVIQKLLKDLKSTGNKEMTTVLDNDHQTVAIVNMLKEVEAVTLAALESLLTCAAGTKVQSRKSGWSLVSKLVHHKSASGEAKERNVSEFEKVDAAVQSVLKSDDNKNIETLQSLLGEFESSVQGLEEDLEHLLRRLIKTRVSLLNILNH